MSIWCLPLLFSSPHHHIHQHPLFRADSYFIFPHSSGGWRCDNCRSSHHDPGDNWPWHCHTCEYDLCDNCIGAVLGVKKGDQACVLTKTSIFSHLIVVFLFSCNRLNFVSISLSVYVMSLKLSFYNNLGAWFTLPSTKFPMQTNADQVEMKWRVGGRVDCKTVSFFLKWVNQLSKGAERRSLRKPRTPLWGGGACKAHCCESSYET